MTSPRDPGALLLLATAPHERRNEAHLTRSRATPRNDPLYAFSSLVDARAEITRQVQGRGRGRRSTFDSWPVLALFSRLSGERIRGLVVCRHPAKREGDCNTLNGILSAVFHLSDTPCGH